MNKILRNSAILATALLAGAPVSANDTTAATGAGGLILTRSDAIDMLSEDLFVSAGQIRVRYVFRNRTKADISTIVAFPMPDRDLGKEYGGDVAYPSDFRTNVASRPVQARLERKAMLGGRDHSALLARLRVPVAPRSIGAATLAMDRLPAAERRRLIALGLAAEEQYDDDGKGTKRHLVPQWTVKDTMWWPQRFPAGRDLNVEHRYVPGLGGSVESPIAFKQFRGTDESKWAIARYCMDRHFIAAVDRLSSKDESTGPRMPDKRIDYILATGANWRAPIGSFRLVVDKGSPRNLVSFCETGVRKISPTQYEVRRTNWRPTRDLHVLIIEPQG